jgi:hypothetical protein
MANRSPTERFPIRLKRAVLAGLAMLALGGLAKPACAAEIYIDNVQLFYSENVNITGTVDGASVNVTGALAGQIVLTVNNGNSSSTSQYILPVWCVDLFHDISLGASGIIYSLGGLDTDNSNSPTVLSAQQINEMTALAVYGNQQMALNPSNLLSAEVQAAIWTVEYSNGSGNSLSISSSNFTPTTIANLIATAGQGNGAAIQLIAMNGTQALIDPVPEPASVGLLVAGLLGLGFARRRKRLR